MQGKHVLAAALAAFGGIASAQDASPQTAPGPTQLPTLNVFGAASPGPVGFVAQDSATALKVDVPLLETPASVSVIGAAEIAERGGASNLGEAVNYMPGVFVRPVFAVTEDAVQVRGFWAKNYLDGLRVGNGEARSGQFSVETYGLERIDVLRGPASVLYGQVTPGGIVNQVSKRPLFNDARESLVRYGSYGQVTGQFDLNGVLGDGGALGWRLVALAQNGGTQMDGVDDDRLFVAPSLTWNMSESTTLTVLTSYRRLDGAEWSNEVVREALETVSPSFNPGEPAWDDKRSDQAAIGYEFVHDFTPNLRFVNNARYSETDLSYRQVFAWNGLTGNPDRPLEVAREAITHDQDIEVFNFDARLEWDTFTGPLQHKLLVGYDYSDNSSDWRGTYGAAPPLDFDDPVHGGPLGPFEAFWQRNGTTEQGLYVQDVASFGPWRATLGGRWTEADLQYRGDDPEWNYDVEERAFVGNVGLLYLSPSGFAPYVSFAQSYEPQVGTDWQGTPFEATRGDQYEVGVKYQPPGVDALLTLSAFQITQSNLSTTDPDHPEFSQQTGEVRVRGLEIEGRAAVGPVDVSLAYTHLDSEITKSEDGVEGNEYTTTPDVASLWVYYQPDAGRLAGLSLGGGARYASEGWADEANTIRTDSTLVFDLALAYDLGTLRPEWQGVRLDLNARNLGATDDIYCEAWGCFFNEQPSYSGALSWNF